ncbi:MAG: sulfite exporter TauE/SafE family protein [Nannocystaceae bacterium]
MGSLRPSMVVAVAVWGVWGWFMTSEGLWSLFRTEWGMSATMMLGSFIAGATSEGGGAVAFPVMTLLFGIQPAVARDFALMIQAVGMTAAAVLIVTRRVKVEWRAIGWSGLGGAVGIVVGLTHAAQLVPPAHAKVFFTSLWLAFAFALYLVNRNRGRDVAEGMGILRRRDHVMLLVVGAVGGLVSSITGSGLDIITFSLLVLAFGVSERVGTPTSVVLMALNAVVGFAWKQGALGGMEVEAFRYWYVCIPVVVVGAPLGAWFITDRSRLFVAAILYTSIGIQFIVALIVIPQTVSLLVTSIATFTVGALAFRTMGRLGEARVRDTR